MSSAQIVSLFYSSQDHSAKEKALQSLTSSQIAALQNKAAAAHHAHHAATHVAAAAAGLATLGLTAPPVTPYTPSPFWQPAGPTSNEDIKPFNAQTGAQYANNSNNNVNSGPAWEGRSIATHKLRLVEFSAFMERHDNDSEKHLFVHIGINSPTYSDPLLESVDIRQIYDKFPEKKGGLKELYDKGPQNAFFLVKFWADLNTSLLDESGAFYGVTSQYESNENMTITCSTKVCSFGKQVVEKVETEYARFENGRFVYRIHRSPMCEYMINFIHKLKQIP
jgi:transcriptional enhancer factor